MVRETCKVFKGEEVHKQLILGSEEIAKAVSTTFGPYGKNVGITMIYNLPHVTKDGATVARSVKLEDPIQNVAAQIINQAAAKTAEVAGDGTTSTTILASSLVKQAFKLIEKGISPSAIKNVLKKQEGILLDILPIFSKPTTIDDIFNIAMVSCNGDEEIAQFVTKAFSVIGEGGVVTIADSRDYKTVMDVTDGIKLDRSYIIPGLNPGKNIVRYKDCKILITNLDIVSEADALTILKLQEAINNPLLVICNDLTGAAADVMCYNKIQRKVPIEIIRAPFIAEARREACIDLAIVTGAFFIDKDQSWTFNDLSDKHLGVCDALEISLKETNIIGRKGVPAEIQERIVFYNNKIEEDREGLKENYKKRLAFFTSGAAVIYVGGSNDVEVQEKKDRFDDTIRAVRSALSEGYVQGGTICYLDLANKLDSDNEIINILVNSLYEITRVLLANGDMNFENDLSSHVKSTKINNIIDPTLVIKSTIQNAIGAAIMIFTTDCIVAKNEE